MHNCIFMVSKTPRFKTQQKGKKRKLLSQKNKTGGRDTCVA